MFDFYVFDVGPFKSVPNSYGAMCHELWQKGRRLFTGRELADMLAELKGGEA